MAMLFKLAIAMSPPNLDFTEIPDYTQALTTLSNPNLPDGSIAAIYERGYMLRDQLLRPARVVVNHNPDADTAPGAESSDH